MKTLLLNADYQILSFITERRMLKLLFNDKCEVLNEWDSHITWASGKIRHPSTVKLKYLVKRVYFNSSFNRSSIIKRDRSTCQYCSKKLTVIQITIDHVVPKAQNGATSFTNCVVSCTICNSVKANRTPEQASMKLLNEPVYPSFSSVPASLKNFEESWHSSWDDFL